MQLVGSAQTTSPLGRSPCGLVGGGGGRKTARALRPSPPVIPSERSESRDLHSRSCAPDAWAWWFHAEARRARRERQRQLIGGAGLRSHPRTLKIIRLPFETARVVRAASCPRCSPR